MRQLSLLLALHEHRSLRKAAEQIGLTQPAATKMLHEMEDVIGLKLFDRLRRGVQPTAYGEVMTRYAQVVFSDLGGVRDELVAIESGNIGKIRIGAIMAPAPQLLSDTLIMLKQRHPRLAPSIQIDTSDVLITALLQDRLDVAIGRVPDNWDSRELMFEPIAEEALSIVAGPSNPEVRNRKVTLAGLLQYPWVLQAHPSPMRKVLELVFMESGLALPINILETSSMLLTSSLLRQSDMLAVMPTLVAKHYEERKTLGIVPLKIKRQIPSYGIITRKGRILSPASQVFILEIRAAMESTRLV
ncbi:LysR family transcriptional regulator [Paralcaligenes ginsengisoli]